MSTGGVGQGRTPLRAASRLRLAGASERSSGVDERLATIFRDMRRALSLTKPDLARRLRTKPSVIDAMEAGRVRGLPPWPETVRIVSELGKLLRVDVRPVLARIRDQIGPAGLSQVPATRTSPSRRGATTSTPATQPAKVDDRAARAATRDKPAGKRQHRVRQRADRAAKVLSALTAPVVLIAGLLWLAQSHAGAMIAGVGALPGPLATLARPFVDYVVTRAAPERDGLRWIEVADPRSRKSDKLRQASR